MRLIKYLVLAWVVLLLAVFVVPRLILHKSTSTIPAAQANIANNAERNKQTSDPQRPDESKAIKETISHFLDTINNGDLETAVTYVEPNYAFTLFAASKGTPQDIVLKRYVTLFDPKQLLRFNDISVTSIGTNYSCKVNLTMSDNSTKKFTMIAVPMNNDEGIGRVWYFRDVIKE